MHFLLSLILLLFLVGPAWSANYYISLTGNDTTGDGSVGTPWRTLYKACTTVTTGNTIQVGSGTFVETSSCPLPTGVSIQGVSEALSIISYSDGGTAAIQTIDAQGTNGNQTISYLTFNGNSAAAGGIMMRGRMNVTITHVTFLNFVYAGAELSAQSEPGEPTTYSTGNSYSYITATNAPIWLNGWDGGSVHDCNLTHSTADPLAGLWFLGYFKNIDIYNNVIVGAAGPAATYFAIEMWNFQGGNKIRNNTITGPISIDSGAKGASSYSLAIYDNTIGYAAQPATIESVGIAVDGWISDLLIYRNRINNSSVGVLFNLADTRAMADISIYYNIFSGLGFSGGGGWGAGVRINVEAGATGVSFTRLKIDNNVFNNNSGSGEHGIQWYSYTNLTSSYFYARNNIITGMTGAAIRINPESAGGTLAYVYTQNNDFYANGTDGLEDNLPATNKTTENNITTNPLFVSSPTDYSLQSGSPAINTGRNICQDTGVPFATCTGEGTGTYTDYVLATVPKGSAPDMGAYEAESKKKVIIIIGR